MAKAHTVGIVGLGFGRAHIPAFQANGCEVVAVCQRSVETAQPVAKQYGIPQVFEHWEEMLDKARPDIVVIASPPALHLQIATAALSRGAHVLCEKPLAMDAAQCGAMGDMGVHVIDLVRWHFGEFTRVTAQAGIAHPSRPAPGGRATDAEDFCSVLGELASGAQVTFTVSRAARGANDQTPEAYGAAGALRYNFVRQGRRWHLGALKAAAGSGGFEPVKLKAGLPRSAGEGDQLEVIGKATIGPLVKRFLKATRTGQSPSPSFEDGLRAQAVLDAVLRAQRDGGWVPVATG